MKSAITKLLAVIFIAVLAVGCASSITAPQQPVEKKQIKKENTVKPGTTLGRESEMDPIKERPDL